MEKGSRVVKLGQFTQEDLSGAAKVLDALASGEEIALGEFSDAGSGATEADVIAAILYEIAAAFRPSLTAK